jgi:hypothetical protein
MANHYFAPYLIDHLAGSAVALELLEDLATAYAGTALASFFVEFQNDIAADQQASHSYGSAMNSWRNARRNNEDGWKWSAGSCQGNGRSGEPDGINTGGTIFKP